MTDLMRKDSRISSRAYHTTESKYNNNKHIVIFYKKSKKYNEIQLTKNKMEFDNRLMKKSSTLPSTKILN